MCVWGFLWPQTRAWTPTTSSPAGLLVPTTHSHSASNPSNCLTAQAPQGTMQIPESLAIAMYDFRGFSPEPPLKCVTSPERSLKAQTPAFGRPIASPESYWTRGSQRPVRKVKKQMQSYCWAPRSPWEHVGSTQAPSGGMQSGQAQLPSAKGAKSWAFTQQVFRK